MVGFLHDILDAHTYRFDFYNICGLRLNSIIPLVGHDTNRMPHPPYTWYTGVLN